MQAIADDLQIAGYNHMNQSEVFRVSLLPKIQQKSWLMKQGENGKLGYAKKYAFTGFESTIND